MKRPEALLRIVFEVTEVMCKLVLNVSCARNQRGATCQAAQVILLLEYTSDCLMVVFLRALLNFLDHMILRGEEVKNAKRGTLESSHHQRSFQKIFLEVSQEQLACRLLRTLFLQSPLLNLTLLRSVLLQSV